MNKFTYYTRALLICYPLLISAYFPSDMLWHGIIKFPTKTKNISPPRVYYGGIKIPTALERRGEQVSFNIPESKIRNTFFLIISDQIEFITKKNTPQCLKIAEGHPYKLYFMEFQPNAEAIKTLGNKIDAEQMGSWHVTQRFLADDQRIPDNTITVCYHPLLVKNVEGGNGLELPKIILDEFIMTQLSDDEIQDASIQCLLTSLNCNSIHARQNTDIKTNFPNKNILSMICS